MSHPTIYWAQRSDVVYLRFHLMGVEDVHFNISETGIDFSATCAKQPYACKFDTYEALSVEGSTYKVVGQGVEAILKKKEAKDEYWPALNKGPKLPYIRIDWDKWLDEDEKEGPDSSFPGADFGGMDFGGMPGAGGMPKFDPSQFQMPEGGDDAFDDEEGEEDSEEPADAAPVDEPEPAAMPESAEAPEAPAETPAEAPAEAPAEPQTSS